MCESRNEINNEIINLWEQYHEKLDLKYKKKNNKKKKAAEFAAELFWPNLHLPAPEIIDLLVIGLNPSHKFPKHKIKVQEVVGTSPTKNAIFKKIFDPIYTDGDIVDALKYSNKGYQVDDILEFEKIGQEWHNYFQKFWKLGESIFSTKLTTHHIDLYQFRESSSVLMKNNFIPNNVDFFQEQAKLTFGYIKELNPKIIFVANKYASDEFYKKYKPQFDENWGCYKLTIDDNETPLILSGMITQSRSIDDYSFERLIWHLNYINTSLNNV